MAHINNGFIAGKVAETLDWAVRQASFPLFTNVTGIVVGEVGMVELTLNNPGPVRRFQLMVRDITCTDHQWEPDPDCSLADKCVICGEGRA